jgi:Ca2+-binding RTX toxin-like protein
MANITGTAGNDTLRSTVASDTILGLGGDDLIISSDGDSDLIDGGAGKDTIDYSTTSSPSNLELSADGSLNVSHPSSSNRLVFDRVNNIETIIGSLATFSGQPNRRGSIFINANDVTVDLDLSKNRLTYSSPSIPKKTLAIKNFTSFSTNGSGKVRIVGDDFDNSLFGGNGSSTIVGSKGNDNLLGSRSGESTLDYRGLGNAVKFSPLLTDVDTGAIVLRVTVDKGASGIDEIRDFKKIIGTANQENTIELLNPIGAASLDVNLANNSLKLNLPTNVQDSVPNRVEEFQVLNFVSVVGTKNNDTITGGNKKGTLTGGGGNDTITGGNKNDIITGTDSTARGVGEVDTLTGGGGRDKFVLGDTNGAYYVGKGKDDYALITDFNLFQDSIDLGGFKNYSFASGGNNIIELYSGKDVNTRDLIAKIQLAGGISSVRSNSRSIVGASQNIDSITSKIDIVSGSSSIAEAVV